MDYGGDWAFFGLGGGWWVPGRGGWFVGLGGAEVEAGEKPIR